MRMPNMTAEATLYRRGGYGGFAATAPFHSTVSPATLICNSVCLASWGIGCAIFCRTDTNCLKQCGADAIKTCCVGSAPFVEPILS